MLKPWQKNLILAALVVAVGLWIQWWASSAFILEGQICEPTNPPANCELYNVFLYSAWRLAKATDHWSALIAAVFTVVLAVFTGRLWYSTEGLFRVTKIVADADRPHMLVDFFKVSGIRQPPTDDGNVRTTFEYRFINYGRSPAFVKKYLFAVRIGVGDLPATPEYGEPISTNYIIGIKGWYGSLEPSSILVPQNEVAMILNGTGNYIIFGYIEYSDVAAVTHRHRFAYNFEWGAGDTSERFRPIGPDTYREYT
jgi:hypothetical protein